MHDKASNVLVIARLKFNSALLRELQSIFHKVYQHLLETPLVAYNDGQGRLLSHALTDHLISDGVVIAGQLEIRLNCVGDLDPPRLRLDLEDRDDELDDFHRVELFHE